VKLEFQQKMFYQAIALFIVFMGVAVYAEVFWLLALPMAFVIVGFALFKLHWLFLLITFSTPLSLNIDDVGGGMGLAIPTDPLLFGAMLIFLIRQALTFEYDRRILAHPITIAILLQLFWLLITAITSDLPTVSFKYFISRLWFVISIYFIGVQIFKHPELFRKYLWMYVVPFAGVIVYTLYNQAIRNFDVQAAHWVMQPFFKDHTIYGAMLAMFIPVLFSFVFYKKYDINAQILAGVFSLVFLVGVVASLTRAAWVSLFLAGILYIVIKLRPSWWVITMSAVTFLAIGFSLQDTVIQRIEKNRQDSSGDLAEHVQSISNMKTDASNLERLNRWDCAFRMFAESPVFGKGPGTYSFLYAPYQRSANLTVISTNFGDLGNAHSEYFGPLAEQGVLGLVSLLAIIFFAYYRGIPLYYRMKDREHARLFMGILMGLTTYFIHGLLNNYLDQDKAAIAFWGFLAVITAFDIYEEKQDLEAKSSLK